MGKAIQFRPTHRVTLRSGEVVEVMQVESKADGSGPAFTREEWESETMAVMELVEGEWLFQGEAFAGTVESV